MCSSGSYVSIRVVERRTPSELTLCFLWYFITTTHKKKELLKKIIFYTTNMFMMIRVVSGIHRGSTGVKLSLTDKTMTFWSFSKESVVRVPRAAVRQMILPHDEESPEFAQEPTDSQLRTLWSFVQRRYNPQTHTLRANCPDDQPIPRAPPIDILRQMYREQPPLTQRIRVVSCVRK